MLPLIIELIALQKKLCLLDYRKNIIFKESVWAKLKVESGQLVYVIVEPGEEEEIIVTA